MTKVVRPLQISDAPVQYIVIDQRKSDTLFSCFIFSAAPTIINSPSSYSIKCIPSTPTKKLLMNSPNQFPIVG